MTTKKFCFIINLQEGDKMKLSSFSQLINTDFDIKNITVTPYTFEPCNKVEYKQGRKNNLLHFVTYGTRSYNVNSRKFEVKEGDIIFIPTGTVYSCYTEKGCSGIGICFDMESEGPIVLPPDVYTEWQKESNTTIEYINKMTDIYTTSPTSMLPVKALLLQTLYLLFEKEKNSKTEYRLIKPALDYIGDNFTLNVKISYYAALCNISESYFRKTFVKCMGISPVDYRNKLRFIYARKLYSQGKTLQEIAELTGFYDAGFLSKAYKKQTGDTLKNTFEIM